MALALERVNLAGMKRKKIENARDNQQNHGAGGETVPPRTENAARN
jgi:hypothetical protein